MYFTSSKQQLRNEQQSVDHSLSLSLSLFMNQHFTYISSWIHAHYLRRANSLEEISQSVLPGDNQGSGSSCTVSISYPNGGPRVHSVQRYRERNGTMYTRGKRLLLIQPKISVKAAHRATRTYLRTGWLICLVCGLVCSLGRACARVNMHRREIFWSCRDASSCARRSRE